MLVNLDTTSLTQQKGNCVGKENSPLERARQRRGGLLFTVLTSNVIFKLVLIENKNKNITDDKQYVHWIM